MSPREQLLDRSTRETPPRLLGVALDEITTRPVCIGLGTPRTFTGAVHLYFNGNHQRLDIELTHVQAQALLEVVDAHGKGVALVGSGVQADREGEVLRVRVASFRLHISRALAAALSLYLGERAYSQAPVSGEVGNG